MAARGPIHFKVHEPTPGRALNTDRTAQKKGLFTAQSLATLGLGLGVGLGEALGRLYAPARLIRSRQTRWPVCR